ncbi:MAG: acyltransferase [Thermodesulfobacteriota bacterium]
MAKQTAIKSIVKSANFIFDRVFTKIWWLFLPFKLATTLLNWLSTATWLLSNEYIKHTLGSCGHGVRIHGRIHLTGAKHIHIGDNVHINDNAFFRGQGGLWIGNNTHISKNLVVYTTNHQYQGSLLPYDEQKILKPVKIGTNVWIGTNVCIVPGVTIGDGAIIGMGVVVSQDVPPLAIIGAPVYRSLKMRDKKHYDDLVRLGAYGGMSGYKQGYKWD